MAVLSKKQREIQAREGVILDEARKLLLKGGYHGLTMARVAEATCCSKGTVYQHFPNKEEIIVALAVRSVDKQRALVEQAATFRGRPRERMIAVATATELFALLHRDDARIFQIMNGEAILQKASEGAIWRMRASANRTVSIMFGIVRDAVAQGDLPSASEGQARDVIFHFWLLGEAGKASRTSWLPPSEMGIADPFASIIRSTQYLGDGFGWRPLSTEWDYEETRRRVCREVFPNEARQVYGGNVQVREA
ncbi:MAG: TetR/AcrR family transcriptional regulator [Candidatus Hydrogenedentes bacterium]|nr:TetR/AcrR family transcriptional regulator [Candidatus Hydrogenedentota bacterium]